MKDGEIFRGNADGDLIMNQPINDFRDDAEQDDGAEMEGFTK
jgi:hypothetical protein